MKQVLLLFFNLLVVIKGFAGPCDKGLNPNNLSRAKYSVNIEVLNNLARTNMEAAILAIDYIMGKENHQEPAHAGMILNSALKIQTAFPQLTAKKMQMPTDSVFVVTYSQKKIDEFKQLNDLIKSQGIAKKDLFVSLSIEKISYAQYVKESLTRVLDADFTVSENKKKSLLDLVEYLDKKAKNGKDENSKTIMITQWVENDVSGDEEKLITKLKKQLHSYGITQSGHFVVYNTSDEYGHSRKNNKYIKIYYFIRVSELEQMRFVIDILHPSAYQDILSGGNSVWRKDD